MKLILATEMLLKKSKRRNQNELNDLMSIILRENDWFDNAENKFLWFDEFDKCLVIDVDEKSFELNGLPLENWLNENTDCDTNSDKRFRVFGLNR